MAKPKTPTASGAADQYPSLYERTGNIEDINTLLVPRAARAAKAPAAPTGWYALAADGMATLCVDRDDAAKEAANSEKKWPHLGPYRAVQLYTAPPAPTEQWVSVEERLPEPGEPVLLDIGKRTPIRAEWVKAKTLIAHGDCDFGEYDEAADDWYWPEGWYEWNEHEETHWAVTETALNWMPLPAPPQGAAKGAT